MRTAPAVNFGLPIIVSTLLALLAGAIGAAILAFTFDFLITISQNDDAANGVFVIVESLTAVLSLASLAIIQFFAGIAATSARDAFDGKKVTLALAWKRSRGRRWALIGMTVLMVSGFGVSAGVFFAPSIILALTVNEIMGVLAFFVGGLIWAVLIAFFLIKFAFVGPLITYERLPLKDAVKRSWKLTNKGFWRILGELALGYYLSSHVVQIMITPVMILFPIVMIILTIATGFQSAAFETVVLVIFGLFFIALTIAVSGLMLGYWSALVVVVFFDQKMRLEGFDLVMLREAEDEIRARTRNEGESVTKDQWLAIPQEAT
ncbi:MFS family permease [Brevibacterium paucivorans]|uniref:MFS family permease n=1 Tax=Brevibacterium paucivorans TaxID=170994 RepID=A0ABS2SJK2_9MICO|nr:glycerophosphoryl diester phosphodiesterase membrane domain-containing protein [Brevibacterium paucivorans]MBM7815774.1 MFS family permease [Brevibacterium paucivorans]